jgi:hypothetical protein
VEDDPLAFPVPEAPDSSPPAAVLALEDSELFGTSNEDHLFPAADAGARAALAAPRTRGPWRTVALGAGALVALAAGVAIGIKYYLPTLRGASASPSVTVPVVTPRDPMPEPVPSGLPVKAPETSSPAASAPRPTPRVRPPPAPSSSPRAAASKNNGDLFDEPW